jgi:hypothetical protein
VQKKSFNNIGTMLQRPGQINELTKNGDAMVVAMMLIFVRCHIFFILGTITKILFLFSRIFVPTRFTL